MRAMAEMRVCIADGGGAVRGPTGVGNAAAAFDAVLCILHLTVQVSHTGDTAHAQECGLRARPTGHAMHSQTAGVIASIFQELQALDQHGNDVALRDDAEDAAHSDLSVCKFKVPCF